MLNLHSSCGYRLYASPRMFFNATAKFANFILNMQIFINKQHVELLVFIHILSFMNQVSAG